MRERAEGISEFLTSDGANLFKEGEKGRRALQEPRGISYMRRTLSKEGEAHCHSQKHGLCIHIPAWGQDITQQLLTAQSCRSKRSSWSDYYAQSPYVRARPGLAL